MMKRIVSIFCIVGLCTGQSYTITILGMIAAEVEQTINDSGSIQYNTQNRGLFDVIWPTKNTYTTYFDKTTFGVKQWNKQIHQGEFKSELNAKKNSENILVYDKEYKIEIMDSTQTLFTLLAMIQHRGADAMDTKWFSFEHEGQTGKARFLLADSQNVWNGKDSIMCDHYRLDLNLSNNSGKFLEKSDYFMEEIIVDNLVRELWVSKRKPKIIIRASLKTYWLPVMAQINE